MFTRGCLLALLSVPATWVLVAWLALGHSGTPGSEVKSPAGPESAYAATAGLVPAQAGRMVPDRSGMAIQVRLLGAVSDPAQLRSQSLYQCTRYFQAMLLAGDSDRAHGSRASACSRMVTLWTRHAMNRVVAALKPMGAWTRFHALLSGQPVCSSQTVG